jgi:LacI family transcriptional regulator
MTARKRVTIKEVAHEAGVSTQTVSRVINNRPDVALETRRRVQAIIDRLGYQPSRLARSLSQGRSCILGVVGSGLQHYGPSRTLAGIEKEADKWGYSLLLSLIHQSGTHAGEQLLREMFSRHVDGIIWAQPEIGNNREWLQRESPSLSVPIVFLSMRSHPDVSVVAIDNRRGGRMATDHLLQQDRRHIAIITGPLTWWEARQRHLGWREALEGAGIPADVDLVAEGDWTPASGERGLRRLLEQRPDLDAVFVSNDQMALGVLQAAGQMGRRVPDDLAIVGFDDIPEAAYFYPPLSTVRQDVVELGRRAVTQLRRAVDARNEARAIPPPQSVLLSPQLIVRASSVVSEPLATAGAQELPHSQPE